MNISRYAAPLILALVTCCATASAQTQPLSGIYTCANGNPGNAFDYGDIGQFFNDLENLGVSGPVVLELHDDGGPFVSSDSYLLGADYVGGVTGYAERPILGVGASNTLTLRAASNKRPVITGAGARNPQAITSIGGATFFNVPHLTLYDITFADNGRFALLVYCTAHGASDYIRIANCFVLDSPNACAFLLEADSPMPPRPTISFVTIENNVIVRCGTAGVAGAFGLIQTRYSGLEWVVRHNTIHCTSSEVFYCRHPQAPWEVFQANVIHLTGLVGARVFAGTYVYPLQVDYNVLYIGPQNGFAWDVWTWAQWQALGFDANGVNADPRLVSVVPGLEDLRLRADSPARDLVPFGPLTDVFGNPRPVGARFDAGAHEFEHAPTLEIIHQGADIPHGGALNAGTFNVLGDLRGFTLRNIGPVDLTLTGNPLVEIMPFNNIGPGTVVQSQPALSLIPPAASVNFTIFIQPAAVGPFHLRVSISNSDPHYSPYYFEIIGDVPFNQPAEAAPGAMLTGPPGGPFVAALDPGATAGLTVQLTDPEADAINVLSITPLGAPALGVLPPGIPAPGHPLALSWTGVVDAANPPGLYQWQLEFADAVNQTPQVVIIELTIRDLPPGHAPVAPGAGTQGNPYTATFAVGDDSSASAPLADVADPNSAQALAVSGFSPNAAFTFALVGGQLTASPRAVLIPAELGVHNFALSISDGTNAITVYAALTVQAAGTLAITTPSPLPVGALDAAYSVTLQATGATGAVVWALTGALPTGLYLDVGTGAIAGTPGEAGQFSFTITARDAVTQTAAPFDLTIAAPPPPPRDSAGTSGGSGGGCAAGAAAWPWILALALWRRRRV